VRQCPTGTSEILFDVPEIRISPVSPNSEAVNMSQKSSFRLGGTFENTHQVPTSVEGAPTAPSVIPPSGISKVILLPSDPAGHPNHTLSLVPYELWMGYDAARARGETCSKVHPGNGTFLDRLSCVHTLNRLIPIR
jgi:hypothetical protein